MHVKPKFGAVSGRSSVAKGCMIKGGGAPRSNSGRSKPFIRELPTPPREFRLPLAVDAVRRVDFHRNGSVPKSRRLQQRSVWRRRCGIGPAIETSGKDTKMLTYGCTPGKI